MVFTFSLFAEDYMKEDGTFDFGKYFEYNVKIKAHNDTNTLIKLFSHYDKVKDDPFSLSTLSNDIVKYIYHSSSFFDSYDFDIIINDDFGYYILDDDGSYLLDDDGNYYTDMNRFNDIYQILYDNIDSFDINNKNKIKKSLEWFLNNQIHEAKLFNEIRDIFVAGEENKLIKIKLRNFDDKTNGLIIKHKGKVVPGILGLRTDYEYTIDYNGKKDVKIKYVVLRITYLDRPSLFGAYITDDAPTEYYATAGSILINENNYYVYGSFDYPTEVQRLIFSRYIWHRDFNKHEDGIVNVEIVK